MTAAPSGIRGHPHTAPLRRLGLALLMALGPALMACMADLPPSLMVPKGPDGRFGYSDKRLSPTSFEVTYLGPEVKTTNTAAVFVAEAADKAKETTEDLALWRAARLSLDQGYPAFAVTDAKTEMQEFVIGRDYRDAPVSVYENINVKADIYSSQYFFRPQVTLTIELRDRAEDGALDARETAERVERQYADAPTRPVAAGTTYYFGPASWLYAYKPPKAYKAPEAYEGAAKPPPSGPRYQSTHPFVPYHGAQ